MQSAPTTTTIYLHLACRDVIDRLATLTATELDSGSHRRRVQAVELLVLAAYLLQRCDADPTMFSLAIRELHGYKSLSPSSTVPVVPIPIPVVQIFFNTMGDFIFRCTKKIIR